MRAVEYRVRNYLTGIFLLGLYSLVTPVLETCSGHSGEQQLYYSEEVEFTSLEFF